MSAGNDPFLTDSAARRRQRLWGFTVLLALLVIFLPLLFDGSGSESSFPRVEELRKEPPIVRDDQGIRAVRTPADRAAAGSASAPLVNVMDQDDGSVVTRTQPAGSPAGALSSSDGSATGLSASSADVPDPAVQAMQPAQTDQTLAPEPAVRSATPLSVDQGNNASRNSTLVNEPDSTTGSGVEPTRLSEGGAGTELRTEPGTTPGTEPVGESGAEYAIESATESSVEPQGNSATEAGTNPGLTAWVVLAGAYRQETSAVAVRDLLRNEGFASFVRERDNSEELYQVLVGPMIKEQGALEIQSQVAALLNNAPVIMTYP